ncbi:MAG TPA: hypothetical protein VI504_10795 [Candidatus Eisenbacteria bacterium]|jgi:hypothetical protein
MGLLDKLKFQLWDDVGAVVDLIAKWRPRKCETEKDFEKSLYAYLHEAFEDTQITKQFAQGRMRADLMVGGKVIIELKHNLDSTAKLQRLIGQLSQYDSWKGRVIVLLTGETEPNLLKELKQFIRKQGWDDLDGEKVTITQK